MELKPGKIYRENRLLPATGQAATELPDWMVDQTSRRVVRGEDLYCCAVNEAGTMAVMIDKKGTERLVSKDDFNGNMSFRRSDLKLATIPKVRPRKDLI